MAAFDRWHRSKGQEGTRGGRRVAEGLVEGRWTIGTTSQSKDTLHDAYTVLGTINALCNVTEAASADTLRRATDTQSGIGNCNRTSMAKAAQTPAQNSSVSPVVLAFLALGCIIYCCRARERSGRQPCYWWHNDDVSGKPGHGHGGRHGGHWQRHQLQQYGGCQYGVWGRGWWWRCQYQW